MMGLRNFGFLLLFLLIYKSFAHAATSQTPIPQKNGMYMLLLMQKLETSDLLHNLFFLFQ
jgi:hypothetical protein